MYPIIFDLSRMAVDALKCILRELILPVAVVAVVSYGMICVLWKLIVG